MMRLQPVTNFCMPMCVCVCVSVQNITLGVELPITVLNKSERDIDLSGMCLQLRACTRRSLFGVIPLPRYLWRRKVRAQRIGGAYLDGNGSSH